MSLSVTAAPLPHSVLSGCSPKVGARASPVIGARRVGMAFDPENDAADLVRMVAVPSRAGPLPSASDIGRQMTDRSVCGDTPAWPRSANA